MNEWKYFRNSTWCQVRELDGGLCDIIIRGKETEPNPTCLKIATHVVSQVKEYKDLSLSFLKRYGIDNLDGISQLYVGEYSCDGGSDIIERGFTLTFSKECHIQYTIHFCPKVESDGEWYIGGYEMWFA